jgi:hypothetical protein
MVEICVLTYNNGVGIVTDAILLKDLIYNNISEQVDFKFVGEQNLETADVGIWIQNYDINLLNLFKKNIFFINEEWAGINELSNLHLFDYVVCKSNYAKKLLAPYCNAICLPFISKDYYSPSIKQNHSTLHFAGRSIQKNTELILKQSHQITLIDPYSLHSPPNHFVHINKYQTQEELQVILNTHNIHLCTSLYESWGHYLYEGLSTGNEIICSDIPTFTENLDPDLVQFVPTKINLDYTYSFDKQNQNGGFPIRQSFHIEQQHLKDIIDNFKPIGKNEERRKLFKNIINKNSDKLVEFFKNL